MSTWNIEYENSGGTWTLDTAINRPNADLELQRLSTEVEVKLANGDLAWVSPETKSNKTPITMFFAKTSSGFRTQIENYIINRDKLHITTHTGETFIGRFIDMKRVWFTGVEPDEFDMQVIFRRTE